MGKLKPDIRGRMIESQTLPYCTVSSLASAIPFSTPEAQFETDFHAAPGHICTRSRTVPSVRVTFITGSAKQ